MKMKESQTMHLVDPSPWPIKLSLVLGMSLLSMVMLMMSKNTLMDTYILNYFMEITLSLILLMFMLWMRDMLSESMYNGNHTKKVKEGMMLGYMMFIVSEIMMFVSMFWMILNTMINPNYEMFGIWPPYSMMELNGFSLPLNNTLMLLGSGMTMTMAHNQLMTLNKYKTTLYMILTLLLSLWFILNQYIEYSQAHFSINDSIFGSSFYFGTGLHGLHMIMGTMFMFLCLLGILKGEILDKNSMRLEAAMMYWHMLDMMWLFLWLIAYNTLWGGKMEESMMGNV